MVLALEIRRQPADLVLGRHPSSPGLPIDFDLELQWGRDDGGAEKRCNLG
jgi:hypothetical protein